MEKNFKRTLITTALPYANGPVHIGHLAGVYVPADIYARYLRLQGRDVLMIGGSDEHGVPITLRARREGVTPQDIVDRYHAIIKSRWPISEYRLTSIRAQPPTSTPPQPRSSSPVCSTRGSSPSRPRSSPTTRRPANFSPTAM